MYARWTTNMNWYRQIDVNRDLLSLVTVQTRYRTLGSKRPKYLRGKEENVGMVEHIDRQNILTLTETMLQYFIANMWEIEQKDRSPLMISLVLNVKVNMTYYETHCINHLVTWYPFKNNKKLYHRPQFQRTLNQNQKYHETRPLPCSQFTFTC